MRPFDPKVIHQAHHIEGHLPSIRLWVVGLFASAVTASVECDHSIVLREVRQNPSLNPRLKATAVAVQEDHRLALSLFDVSDPHAAGVEEFVFLCDCRGGEHETGGEGEAHCGSRGHEATPREGCT